MSAREESPYWPLLSEHSGSVLRLRKLIEGRRSFVLCFLTFSDSAYREQASSFLETLLGARVRVNVVRDTRMGTEELFRLLSVESPNGPAQLSGLELWPEGIDDLLKRLNHRREALAARCARPVFVWILSRDIHALATRAADLWAWRSGVFDFSLPGATRPREVYRSRTDGGPTDAPDRRKRLEELKRHTQDPSELRPVDVDLMLELGDLQIDLGELSAAEEAYSGALAALSRMDDPRRRAIAWGKIADVHELRGGLERAISIREREELPVYEGLGDSHSYAVTKGQIADILDTQGDPEEALRIFVEEQVPVFRHLGDERSLAITQGRIADVLQARGELDEALRIRTEEALPVFERLGDVRSLAIAKGKIADILQSRGEIDEALSIRTEEEIPVYERLGDVRSLAITWGQIADILVARGEVDEALRIHTEEQIPVLERLGDVRSLAIARGRIADILVARGDVDEALRIYTEEQVPVFERLGDMRSLAIARRRIADILEARGERP